MHFAGIKDGNSGDPYISDPQVNINSADYKFKVEAAFMAVSEQILQVIGNSLENWLKLSVEDKLLQFTSYLSNMRKDLRLGGLTGIYILFKSSSDQIGD
jgi:hypothetical protein